MQAPGTAVRAASGETVLACPAVPSRGVVRATVDGRASSAAGVALVATVALTRLGAAADAGCALAVALGGIAGALRNTVTSMQ